jgi:hypothetical protein
MASRNFNRFQALEKEVKSLYAEVSIAGSGAPTIVKALGVTSVVRNSAGNYTVTLNDQYVRLMHVSVIQLGASQDLTFQLASQAVNSSSKDFVVLCKAANVATDPTNGTSLYIKIDCKNSTAGE